MTDHTPTTAGKAEARRAQDPVSGEMVSIRNDLTKRLRGQYACGPTLANGEPEFGWRTFGEPVPIQIEAANAIEANLTRITELEAEVKALREALKPFAEVANHKALSPGFAKHYMPVNLGLMNGNVVQSLIEWKLTVEDFRRARSLIPESNNGEAGE